jgi:predicted Holliday junction resolvase-like endonuclease
LAYYELFLGVFVGLIVGSMIVYAALRSYFAGQVFGQAQGMASQMFESQKSQLDASIRQTYEAKLNEWKATTLAQAIEENRADAVDASRAVLKGKIAEQIAPLLPGFLAKYNPADARFIGSPIDYLIFRNMSKGDDSEDPIEIVLLDVKTGKAGLNHVQKKIEEAAAGKRISFDVLRVGEPSQSGAGSEESGTEQLKLSVLSVKDIPRSVVEEWE